MRSTATLRSKIIKVLCRKLEKAKDKIKRQAIYQALKRLALQRETAAAGKLRPPGAATKLRLLPRQ